MTKKPGADVAAIHRAKGLALMNCGCVTPVTNWFDQDGQDCLPEHAIVCVCGDDDHGWFTVDLIQFSTVSVH